MVLRHDATEDASITSYKLTVPFLHWRALAPVGWRPTAGLFPMIDYSKVKVEKSYFFCNILVFWQHPYIMFLEDYCIFMTLSIIILGRSIYIYDYFVQYTLQATCLHGGTCDGRDDTQRHHWSERCLCVLESKKGAPMHHWKPIRYGEGVSKRGLFNG